MERFVKSAGGNLVRIGQAIDGFKTKYGYWPTALQIDAETLDMVKKYHLTDEGFKQLSGFVPITPVTGDVSIVTIGIGEDKFDYSREGWSGDPLEIGILRLLSFEPKSSE